MTKVTMSSLRTKGAHLNNRQFNDERRTRTHAMVTELMQQLLNKFLFI